MATLNWLPINYHSAHYNFWPLRTTGPISVAQNTKLCWTLAKEHLHFIRLNKTKTINKQLHDKTYHMTCLTSKDSDQPVQPTNMAQTQITLYSQPIWHSRRSPCTANQYGTDADHPVQPTNMAQTQITLYSQPIWQGFSFIPLLDNRGCKKHMRPAKTQIRLRGCAGWTESLLVALVVRWLKWSYQG